MNSDGRTGHLTTRPRILLHIGYHKTATSLLQECVFGAPAGGFLISSKHARHDLVRTFVRPPPFCFDAGAACERYGHLLEAAAAADKVAVLSHERFSGYPPSGGFDAPIVAERLHECYADAQVLIVVREQVSHIASMYSQYISDGGVKTLSSYLRFPEPDLYRSPGFQPEFMEYHRLVHHYQKLFGKERVLVLPYEALLADPAGFIDRISGFVGAPLQSYDLKPTNVSRPQTMQIVKRWLNLLFRRSQLGPQPLIPIQIISRGYSRLLWVFEAGSPAWLERWLRQRIRRRLTDRFDGAFADSNARLAELTGLDLAVFGYQVARAAPRPRV